MPAIQTIADFWDCEIEHAEVKSRWVSDHLLYIICNNAGRRNLSKLDVEKALKIMAVEQAAPIQWENGHKVLEFSDDSRLVLVAPAANTMAGSSRVMEPGESSVGLIVQGRPSLQTRCHQNRMVLDCER